jgi:glucose/arabinose dehydrogenase
MKIPQPISFYSLLSTFSLLLLMLSCNASKQKSSAPPADKSILTTYNTYCASCHGQQLQQFKILKSYEKPVEELANTIKNGNLDAGMVAFGATLEDKQIQELAQFIKNYDYDQNFVVEKKEDKDYEVEVVIKGLEVPWGMEFLPNGDMLVAERKGALSRFSKTDGLHPIKGLPPIRAKGQGGLMDLKLHPNYEENGWLYISYSYIDEANDRACNTAIIRAKLVNDELTQIESIYKGTPATTTNHHFGNRMVFDREGYLYFSNGERGARDVFPQSLDNTNGKIHRLNDDGTVPQDNPFVGQKDAIPSIYSYGHRNPQGLAMHPVTGQIWEHEHGPRGGDEINLIQPGLNYGWPIITYGINYIGTIITDLTEKEGMEQPLHYYVPSIAPCGMAFLDGDVYPEWKNNLFIGSLRFQYLERLVLNGTTVVYQESMLEELSSRVRDVRVGPDGYLYVAVEGPGRILKILPKD